MPKHPEHASYLEEKNQHGDTVQYAEGPDT